MGKALSSKGLVTWPTIRQGRFRIGTSATTVRIGELTLYDYLRQTKLHTPLVVATLLDQQDWTGFEAAYKPLGRLAYSTLRGDGINCVWSHARYNFLTRT